MATKDEVSLFLKHFKEKMSIWNIIFRDDRGKNAQTLADLEIRPIDREKIIKDLQADDYVDGPLEEKLYGGTDMWVFGKTIKSNEVYIKITLGPMGKCVICISFHIAEYALTFPFKN